MTFGSVHRLGQRPPLVHHVLLQEPNQEISDVLPTFHSYQEIRAFLEERHRKTKDDPFQVLAEGCWETQDQDELLRLLSDAEHLRFWGPSPKQEMEKPKSFDEACTRRVAMQLARQALATEVNLDVVGRACVLAASAAAVFSSLVGGVLLEEPGEAAFLFCVFFSLFCWRVLEETARVLVEAYQVRSPLCTDFDRDQAARMAVFAAVVCITPVGAILLGSLILWNESALPPSVLTSISRHRTSVLMTVAAVSVASKNLAWQPIAVLLAWATLCKFLS